MTMKWKRVPEARFWEMLGMLPPAYQSGLGFLVGEAWTHGRCSVSHEVVPMFQAFIEKSGRYYEAVGPMSIAEFRAGKLLPEEAA